MDENEVLEAVISTAGLGRLLARVGFYGPSVVESCAAWAEMSLPIDMRPYGIVVDADGTHVTPPAALDLLIEQARSRSSPWQGALWSAAAAVLGTIAITFILKRRR